MSFPSGSEGKASTCNAGGPGLIPGWGRSPQEGNGNPLQYSCLENPRDGGAWWAAVYRVTQSRTRLKWLSSREKIFKFKYFIYSCYCSLHPCISNKAIAKIRALPVHLKEFNVFIISIIMSISICHLTKLILQNVVQPNSGHYILLHFLIHKLVSSFLLRQTCRCQHTALQRVLLTLQPRNMVTQQGHRAQPCTVALAKKKKKKKKDIGEGPWQNRRTKYKCDTVNSSGSMSFCSSTRAQSGD